MNTDKNNNVEKDIEFDLIFEPIDKKDPDAYIVEKIEETDGYRVRYIAIDEEPESPRDGENLGTMVCFHKRYELGDKDHGYKKEMFDSWEDLKNSIEENEDAAVILPLYMYDHSGIIIKTGPFEDRWDSGQIGFIFVSKEKVRKEYYINHGDIPEEMLDKVRSILEEEVEIYSNYVNGNVYRIVEEIFNRNLKQIDNSIVGGFYDLEYAKEELKAF